MSSTQSEIKGPLDGIRVLDLTDLSGAFCGRLLGDLGADVVRVEPPQGSPHRCFGPWIAPGIAPDAPQADSLVAPSRVSATFAFYEWNKRSIALDLGDPQGRAQLLRLAEHADVVVESSQPGDLDRLGVGLGALRERNPRLIVASISPFGQSGPHAKWRGSNLVCAAIGGMVFVNGHPGEAPLAPFGLQAYHSGCAYAAIGTLAALLVREKTGRGQHVDVSLTEGALAAVEHVTGMYRQEGRVASRQGTLHWTKYFRAARCRDGWILHCTLGDWTSLLEWVAGDGMADPLLDPGWEEPLQRKQRCIELFDALDRWVAPRSVAEILEGAQLRRLPYAAVQPPETLASDPQLEARGFIEERSLGSVQTHRQAVRFPGAPFALSQTPWRIRRPAPRWNEHAAEILSDPAWTGRASRSATIAASVAAAVAQGSVGATSADRPSPGRSAPEQPAPGRSTSERPLTGVRIVDFTWVVAGPVATRILADLGAEVLKVERQGATDFGTRRGGLSGNLNRGKRSVVLNMADSRGVEIARDLVRASDVVIDNFSARVMNNWGLDYESLRKLRPDVIAVSMSGFGQTGPRRDWVSYGPTLQALAGFPLLMRHPGGEPAGWGYSYADMAAGFMTAFATLAALLHRRRTGGGGQKIDAGQFANLVALLGPSLFDLLRGKPVGPVGNASQEGPAEPHGVFRCAPAESDDDRWIAIAVLSDDDWQRLARLLDADGASWHRKVPLDRLEVRAANRCDVEANLEAWTRGQDALALQERLQAAGISAGVVANAADLCDRDPQLAFRRFFATLETAEGARESFDGLPFQLEEMPGFVSDPGPLLGEHTDDVLSRIAGRSHAEIADLRRAGVIG